MSRGLPSMRPALVLNAKTSSGLVALSLVTCLNTACAIKKWHATQIDDPKADSFAALPHGSHIAILFRGQAFRQGGSHAAACQESRVSDQLGMTQSVLDKIVLPLEQASHTVDIYLVESSNCTLLERIAGLLGGTRVRFQESFKGTKQKDGVLKALQDFRSNTLHKPELYRVIIMMRFDLTFKSHIYEWPTVDFDAFNFFSRCEKGLSFRCVSDVMYVLPGEYFAAFQSMIGRGDCWSGSRPASGHHCFEQAVAAFGFKHVRYVTDWRPNKIMREPSPELEIF